MVQFLLFVFASIAVIMAVITLVDVFRRHRGGWVTAGWVVAIIVLPFVGSIAYWVTRPSTPAEVEAAYLAERDVHRTL